MTIKQIEVRTIEETLEFAELIGSKLRGAEVIELVGDLGSGKTTFVSGLVKGSGSLDVVSSPTFVINKIYKTPTLEIHHFDLYRLDKPEQAIYELGDILNREDIVVLIEWPGLVDKLIKDKKLIIEFLYQSDINKRNIEIKYDDNLSYLF